MFVRHFPAPLPRIAYLVALILIAGKPGFSWQLVGLGRGLRPVYSQPLRVASARASLEPQLEEQDIVSKPQGLVELDDPPWKSGVEQKEPSWFEESSLLRQIYLMVVPPEVRLLGKVTQPWFPVFVQDQAGMVDFLGCPPELRVQIGPGLVQR